MTSSKAGIGRLLGAFLLLLISASAALTLMVALGALAPAQIFASWAPGRALLEGLAEGPWTDRVFAAGISGAVGLVSLGWLLRSVARPRRNSGVHLLSADSQGFVIVDSRGIASIAAQAARAVSGVVEADVRVRGKGSEAVQLEVRAGVHPGANIKEAGVEARRRVHETVERLVGVEVKDVSVSVVVMEADQLSRLLA